VDHELEVIRDQMEETRASLADKIEALETQARETVQSVSETVTSAVDGAKEVVTSVTEGAQEVVKKVSETVAETVDTVKEKLSVSRYVERYPWSSMGVAVATGFVAAQLVPSFGTISRGVSGGAYYPTSRVADPMTGQAGQPQRRQEGPGWTSTLMGMLSPAFGTLEGLAVGTLMNAVKHFVSRNVPQQWQGDLTRLIDDFTTRMGGKVMQGDPLHELMAAFQQKQDDQQRPAETSPGAPPNQGARI
jgi:ElaB/YqjD/DUF883 family membrane-anchored ribosome-binding protein